MKIAKNIYEACSECGFFYIKNHGIPPEVIAETFDLLKRFFALDLDVKMDAHVQKNPAIRGYEPMLETRLDPRTQGGSWPDRSISSNTCLRADKWVSDVKEAFTMGDCVIEPEQDYVGRTGEQPPSYITQAQNIWPKEAPWWREGLYKYYQYVFFLSRCWLF